ncbi:hypothetical protein ACJRO7_026883, partial [Eucalyptus globulus]
RREGKDVIPLTTAAATSSALMSMELQDGGIGKSRESIVQEIMATLADNSNSVVGVYGMGGVGKSTLVEEVKRRLSEEKLFDWVTMAIVSENPDINRIQREIAYDLDLDMKNEANANVGAKRLHKRLQEEVKAKKKVLIILDNIWEQLNLKSIGIPCGLDDKVTGCKLLLTSRDRDVLRRKMGCDRDFHLARLQEEEAKELFEGLVGEKVREDQFKSLVDEALHKCAGLPFLIIAMANNFKDAELSEWKDALNQIEMSTNKGLSGVINSMLQLSYNGFKGEDANEVKLLLRLCAVYGVSEPSLENLMRYGTGLGLFGEGRSIEDARNRLSSLIHTLQASSFLLHKGEDGFGIHDLVRGFVTSIASRDDPFLVLKDNDKSVAQLPRDKLKSCTAVCFPYVDMKELPKELDCSELQIFLLFTNNESLMVPDSLFASMKKLMVLNVTGIYLTRLPLSFRFLEKLHTLCLEGCLLENVAIIGDLKRLQILSFVKSKIQRLPKEIGQLVELRLLDLNYCSKLYIIDPGVLESLIKLEELYMERSFDQWNAVDQTPPTNASLIELNHMENLCTLDVSIPDPSMLPGDLNIQKLTKYKIQIGHFDIWRLRLWSREYKASRTLILRLNPPSDIFKKECIRTTLDRIDALLLDGLCGNEQSICALSQEGFPKLKHLQVQNNPSIHYILRYNFLIAFKALESLILKNLINLEKICQSHISSKSFSTLKVLQVESCDNMKVLFPPSVVRGLPKLEEIKIVSCKLMHGILEADDCGKVELHNLRVLILCDLPDIKNFLNAGSAHSSSTLDDKVSTQIAFFNGQQISIPSLESLTMERLPNMKEIWSDESPLELSNLRSLNLVRCKSLLKVISSQSLVKLRKLHNLCIRDCNSMQEIFDLDEPSAGEDLWALSELTTFELNQLGSLRHIWNKNPCGIVSLHNLKKLEVDHCDNLGFMFFPSTVKSLVQLRDLTVRYCKKMEAIIIEEEGLGLEALETSAFPMLTNLTLIHLKSLKCFSLRKCSQEARSQDSVKSHSAVLVNREIAFQRLEKLEINRLDSLEFIFFPSMVKSLTQLKELTISYCEKMEAIIMEEEGLGMETSEISTFPMLTDLRLQQLKSLTCFSRGKCARESGSQDRVTSCATVLFNQEDSRYIRHLQTLDVSHCDGLSKMFTPTIAENLVALTKLRISNCRILTEVINDEKGGDGRVVAFNQLKYIELDGLIGLRSFSSGGYTLMFPLLEDIIVTRCPNMKFFSQGPTEASKLKRVQVSKEAWFWVGNLNITIPNMFEEMGTFAGVKKMLLSEFPGLIGKWHNELNPIKSYWQLKSIVVDKCPSFINAVPSRLMLVLDNLGYLQVCDCDLLEEIFDLEGLEVVESTRILPQLRELNLANLPKLRQLWNRDLQESLCFNSLKSLILYNCSNLGHAFSPSMAQCLANLELMEIKQCGQMEGVIVEEEGEGSAMEKITFSKLRWMTMEYLPNLTCFLLGKNHMLECPKLEMMIIAHCPKMESLIGQSWMEDDHSTPSFFTSQVQFPKLWLMDLSHMDNLSKIWTDAPQETLTFDCLWKVEVRNCKGLENLFPYWVATSLTHLEKLQVESCEIEEIVASGDDSPRSNTTQDLFPKLTSLVLHDMPQLKSFCPNLPLNLPLLEELRVTHCEKLSMLSFVASMNRWAQRDDQQDLSDQEAHSSFERDFPNLERLLLVDNNIQMIQDGNFSDDMFSKLKALTLACFHDKKATFPSIFLLERFQNLQSLEVLCSSFEDLFPNEGLVEERKHPVLENLRELKLNKLHNLKCVWREDSLVSKILQSIKTFQVWDCPCLTTIFPTETSFQNLTHLVVKNSSGLVHLVTTSVVTNLVHLTYMGIIGCERMKEVVAGDGNREGKVISFEKLEWLTLKHLPNLECFSSIPSCIFRFPSLLYIKVEECPKMKTFSKGTLSTPKLNYGTLFRYKLEGNWEKGDDLNTTIQKLSA